MKILVRKIGIARVFCVNGNTMPITLLKLCDILNKKTNLPYNGYITCKSHTVKKNLIGTLALIQNTAKKKILSFQNNLFLKKGSFVDISSLSKGKGYSGVMKKHNFKGLESTHGVSLKHRSGGSTGQCQDPGKVFKGKKMSGKHGCKNITIKNILIIDIDIESNIVIVKGVIPGCSGCYVYIKSLNV